MKKLLAVALLCALAAPAIAARKVAVADVDRLLAGKHNGSDYSVAALLADIELTERCSRSCLARWESLHPGPQTHDALVALADASAFLNLPIAELPPDPAPGTDEQRRIVKLAADYLLKTLPMLPNFLADRRTVKYEPPLPDGRADYAMHMTLTPTDARATQVVRRLTIRVAYRDGQEVLDTSTQSRSSGHPTSDDKHSSVNPRQLDSNGEFGPILKLILVDAPHGNLVWSHWERGADGLEAHFSFTVPLSNSHFRVNFPCGSSDTAHFPAYRGEFAVAPTTGAILRLTLFGTLPHPCPSVSSSIATEFGPVQLGGRAYICPLHSVSISLIPPTPTIAPITELNDVVFTNYRLFRAESRIVSVGDAQP